MPINCHVATGRNAVREQSRTGSPTINRRARMVRRRKRVPRHLPHFTAHQFSNEFSSDNANLTETLPLAVRDTSAGAAECYEL